MKKYLILLALTMITTVLFAQQSNKVIDYQYLRDGKSYCAFEIYKSNADTNSDRVNLSFTANAEYSKVEKISIKTGDQQIKISFKVNDQTNSSDKKDLKSYQITIDKKDLLKIEDCDAKIVFKLDNGQTYSLPFYACKYKSAL
ncbi:hypothetical protein EZJ43_11615 [Pedobacter changchengzhani]|uniref:Uncharacterized protein n=1 Tax=Pedobacter changchengzhani TaxID=2529274 RepID=A0A4V2ZZZ3_9SPHI|nr:hypothetical protein [Pedobacter changchengzhani]TDG35663.1 hypothetical protein EZJ43_11615 [Pedobacter changchengzhani]